MRALALALPLALAACSSEPSPEPAPRPTPTVAAPRTLIAADLDLATLGAKVEGPQGTDPEFKVMAGGEEIAIVRSFVACPKGTTACVPADLPDGTVLTYVHTIVPTAVEPSGGPSPEPTGTDTAVPAEVPPSLFRMTRPAPGFRGGVGYTRSEAEAALGAPDPITVTLDDGQLIWRVTAGSGWKPGAPITLWWQTTAPPAGPQEAFQLELAGDTAMARGPFPAAEDKAVERAATR